MLYSSLLFLYIAGEYTVVASTFEPELLGKFILTVASDIKLQIDPIPSEGAVSSFFLIKFFHLFSSIHFFLSRVCLKK